MLPASLSSRRWPLGCGIATRKKCRRLQLRPPRQTQLHRQLTSAIPIAATIPPAGTNASLQKAFRSLQTVPDAKTARELLAELRAALSAMPKNEAVAAIKQFLDSKADAATQLGFKVAKNGLLDDAPTLRTFLLDELARIDPAAAADYSKVILASKDSPDEWAVALRNLANGRYQRGRTGVAPAKNQRAAAIRAVAAKSLDRIFGGVRHGGLSRRHKLDARR